MIEKTQYQFHFFKIRTLRDQRYIVGWLSVSFIVSVLLTAFFALITYLEYYDITIGNLVYGPPKPIDGGPQPPPVVSPWEIFGTDKLTFILLGYDSVDEFAHRSDTLMVGAVDFYARKVKILSIPRDTVVRIPRHGWDRINAAYAMGHEDLTRQTVESFTGVQAEYVVAVNYEGFVKVVDTLGGVDINIEKAMNYDDRRGNLHIHFEPGPQHLTGQQALEYARYRHDATGDFGRIERQQGLIKALFEQAIRPSNWLKLKDLPEIFVQYISVTPNAESDRNPPEIGHEHILSMIGFLTKLDSDSITFSKIETNDIMWEGKSCLVPLYAKTNEILMEIFRDDDLIAWTINGVVPQSDAVSAAEPEIEEEVSTENL